MAPTLGHLGYGNNKNDPTRMLDGEAYPVAQPLVILSWTYTSVVSVAQNVSIAARLIVNSEDIHLSRALNEQHTEPAYYATIFERGIDPDVDNPEICHPHSELPEQLPAVEDILAFRERVCQRITALYRDESAWTNRKLGRALWIGFEHEALHLETFLYMLLQSGNVLPPPLEPRPDFVALAEEAAINRVKNRWYKIPATNVVHGYSDPENDEGPDRFFAWDNERPPYEVQVQAFEAQARPISNGEYARYLIGTGKDNEIPITWARLDKNAASQNGKTWSKMDDFMEKTAIKSVFGPVPLKLASDWPCMASYNEVNAYAKWAGCRIPSFNEVRSIYSLVEQEKLSRDGFETTKSRLHPDPGEIFVDLRGCNIGLQNFHPTPITQNGARLSGLGDMGGAWEWTSTLFEPFDDFKPMDIYPGYSADFMDGKHNVVVGGSWALHPRIAGRKSFINWWQLNYLYPWVTFRLVRDIQV